MNVDITGLHGMAAVGEAPLVDVRLRDGILTLIDEPGRTRVSLTEDDMRYLLSEYERQRGGSPEAGK